MAHRYESIFNLNVAGATTYGTTVKRHGLQLKIAKRHREEYIFSFITQLGQVIFDNAPAARTLNAPVQPIEGPTTGRNGQAS